MNMKYKTKRTSALVISVLVLLAMLVTILPNFVSAANVTASLSPSVSTVQQGNIFTVTVNLSTGSASILDAIGRVNFNPSQLQYISANYAPSSAWGSQGPKTEILDTYYKFDVTTTSNKSGNFGIVQITFKAIADSGTASITLSNVEIGDGDNPPPTVHIVATQNTSVTLTAQSDSSSPLTLTPKATKRQNNTPTKAQSTTSYTASATPIPTTEEQTINSTLNDDEPVPVTGFIDTTGYPVEISIKDENGVPKPDIDIVLADKKSITDENGVALFYGIVAGEYTVIADGVESIITVSTGEPSFPQSYELTQTSENSNRQIIAGTATLALLTIIGALLYRNRNALKKNNNVSTSSSNPSTTETLTHPDSSDSN